ncbi:MAG: hypothetical protein V1772_10185, partial [Chloroflexota bacterium]
MKNTKPEQRNGFYDHKVFMSVPLTTEHENGRACRRAVTPKGVFALRGLDWQAFRARPLAEYGFGVT